jgi:hypothetical protein
LLVRLFDARRGSTQSIRAVFVWRHHTTPPGRHLDQCDAANCAGCADMLEADDVLTAAILRSMQRFRDARQRPDPWLH